MNSSSPKSTSPGRPRDAALDEKILRATLRHLSEYGYSRMSIDAIAEEAGVSKPTMYRRWSGKADLATAALTLVRVAEPPPATGNALDDLKAALRNFSRSLLRPNGMALIGTVLAEEEHTPELLKLFRERLVAPRRAIVRETLRAGQASGEISSNADIEAAANLLVGSFYARYLEGLPIGDDWADRVAGIVWKGLR
ncbi:MAG: TetR/AcrR family transcriptional regulator [Bryobacterales bacterium]|nr:TetR/AcrR family transcriptional regulator [Bryobacterales bacterium]